MVEGVRVAQPDSTTKSGGARVPVELLMHGKPS